MYLKRMNNICMNGSSLTLSSTAALLMNMGSVDSATALAVNGLNCLRGAALLRPVRSTTPLLRGFG